MAGHLDWDGDRYLSWFRAELARRVKACCKLVASHAKQLLSISGTGVREKSRKARGNVKAKRKGSRIYGANPSAPGEPPHKQLGHLRRSVTYEVDEGKSGRVGTNLLYGRWLELGTRLMAARPWLRRALRECRDAIERILSAPMKGP